MNERVLHMMNYRLYKYNLKFAAVQRKLLVLFRSKGQEMNTINDMIKKPLILEFLKAFASKLGAT